MYLSSLKAKVQRKKENYKRNEGNLNFIALNWGIFKRNHYLCNVLTEFHSSISKQNLIVELKNKTRNRNKLNGTTLLLASVLLDIVSKI